MERKTKHDPYAGDDLFDQYGTILSYAKQYKGIWKPECIRGRQFRLDQLLM
jgi:hypothetical protein